MQYKITCPFFLISSHEIQDVGFRGGNHLKLTTPFKQDNPLGFENTTIEVEQIEGDKYNISAISTILNTKEKQIEFLEKISEYISFLINRTEHNPHYGTIFVKIEWFEFNAVLQSQDCDKFHDTLYVSDALALSSTRTFELVNEDWQDATYNDLLRFYFDGLRAEHKKSIYFHWFLILEYLENSRKYILLFDNNKLFDDTEKQLIKNVAEKMTDNTKKSALLNLLSRTKEFRNAKLLKMLNHLNITNYNSSGKQVELTKSIIRDITQGRNALFHSGTEFPEATLWNHLFPLVTLVVEYVSSNPGCLYA